MAIKGWGRAELVRAFRAGPTAAASARLPTWNAPPSSCAALDNCIVHHQYACQQLKLQQLQIHQ